MKTNHGMRLPRFLTNLRRNERKKKVGGMKCMLGLAHSTTYDFFYGFHLLDSNKFLVNDPGVAKYSDLLSDLLACLPNCQPARIKNERSWPGRFYTTGCQSDLSAYVRRVRKYRCSIDIGLDTFVYHRLISHGIEKRVGQLKEKWNGEIFNSRVSDCIAPPISKNCCCARRQIYPSSQDILILFLDPCSSFVLVV